MSRLAGKVAVVTGANSGIGYAAARRFAEEGAKVYITGRRAQELETARASIRHNVIAVQSDVTDFNELDRLFEQVGRESGRLDVLMLNAAFAEFTHLAEMTEEHFDATFDTNVRATVFGLQKALPVLRDGASVIITGSISSTVAAPNFSAYGASKGALRSFARYAMVDLKDRRIRVNVLSPGHTRTPALDRLVPPEHQEAVLTSTVPLGRLGTPEDMANAALFLASDESSYVNGTEIIVDGGVVAI